MGRAVRKPGEAVGRERPLRLVMMHVTIAAAGLVVYLNSFTGVLLFDDLAHIIHNPRLHHFWPLWGLIQGTTRPLVDVSLAANYALGGLEVWGYHAVNVTIHLMAALVLFGVVRRTLQTERLQEHYGQAASWLALSIALLWVVHPLQTQSVTYIVQRAESLMGLCYLLTLYAVIRSATSARHARSWSLLAILACAAGMASKPVMVTAPLMVLLYDRTFLTTSVGAAVRRRRGLYLGLAATWGLLAVLFVTAPHAQLATAGFDVGGISPSRYASFQPAVLLHYLRLALWPEPLCLDYLKLRPAHPTIDLLPTLIIGGLGMATLWALYHRKGVGILGAAFFLILMPTSSFFPLVDFVVEHRMYLSLAAVVTLVVIGVWRVLDSRISLAVVKRGVASCLVGMTVITLGWLTVRRNRDYQSELRMWQDVVRKQPENFRAHNGVGAALLRQGVVDEAAPFFLESIRIQPKYAEPYNNLGVILFKQGKFDEAISRFSQAVQFRPQFDDAHLSLGHALAREDRLDEAMTHYREVLRLKPASMEARYFLGNALAQQDQFDEAYRHLSHVIARVPDHAGAHKDLGSVLVLQNRLAEGVTHLTEALRLRPDDAQARATLEHAQRLLVQRGARPHDGVQ